MQEYVDCHRGPGPVFRTIFWSQFWGSDARSPPVKQQASFFHLFGPCFFHLFGPCFSHLFGRSFFHFFKLAFFHLVGLPGSHVFGLPFSLRLINDIFKGNCWARWLARSSHASSHHISGWWQAQAAAAASSLAKGSSGRKDRRPAQGAFARRSAAIAVWPPRKLAELARTLARVLQACGRCARLGSKPSNLRRNFRKRGPTFRPVFRAHFLLPS